MREIQAEEKMQKQSGIFLNRQTNMKVAGVFERLKFYIPSVMVFENELGVRENKK